MYKQILKGIFQIVDFSMYLAMFSIAEHINDLDYLVMFSIAKHINDSNYMIFKRLVIFAVITTDKKNCHQILCYGLCVRKSSRSILVLVLVGAYIIQ